jgi:2-keto-4-pentenoate hydratase/2-oxohepta-3-ene-1,7-dioic acid hydratase in catechol pathway
MLKLIEAGPPTWARARAVWDYGRALVDRREPAELGRRRIGRSLARTSLLAPIPRPRKNVFCLGRNYAPSTRPSGVPRRSSGRCSARSLGRTGIGPGAPIVRHAVTEALDSEVELAAVVGRGLQPEDALGHVFGYTVLNDVTARDLQKAHEQWFKGKALDSFCPMGPVLVTADEIPDPQALGIRLWVNGEVRQDATTGQMIFDVATLVSVLSAGLTLEPGDALATGTPSGVGATTGRYLQVGDGVEAEIDGLGGLRNPVVAPSSR